MVDDGGVARFCITMAAVAAAGLLGACALFQSTAAEPAAERTNPAMYGEVSRGASHLVPMNSAVSLAMGFASLTGEVRGHCVEVVETQPSGSSLDELEVYYAEDSSSLSRALGVEAHAGAEFGFVNVSAEAKYVTSSVTTHSASFLVVHSVALAPMDALVRYRLTDEALAELRASPQHFYRRCGDQFVAAVQKGATFNAIARIDAASTADRDYLRAHARASYLGFGGGAGVDKEVETKMERLQVQFHVIQSGRQQPIPNFDEFVTRASTLNAEIRGATSSSSSGQVVRFETKPYDIAENWPAGITLPSLHEQARTLEDLAVRHRTLSMSLADLREAQAAPKNPPCENGPQRFEREIANFDAARKRVEERAHVCVTSPMSGCHTEDLAPVPTSAPSIIAECSNVAARLAAQERQIRRKERLREVADRREEAAKQAETRRAVACRGTLDAACNPCRTWAFDELVFEAPNRKPSGDCWDVGCGAPDPVVVISSGGGSRDARRQDSYRVEDVFDPPLRLKSGAQVTVKIQDQDFEAHDSMSGVTEEAPERLEGAAWAIGSGSLVLTGRCVE